MMAKHLQISGHEFIDLNSEEYTVYPAAELKNILEVGDYFQSEIEGELVIRKVVHIIKDMQGIRIYSQVVSDYGA